MPIAPRLRIPGMLVGVLGTALVACGTPAAEAPASPSPSSSTAVFPVTIEHRYGATTIPGPSHRLVTIGDEDTAYALGVTPVGIIRDTQTPGGVPARLRGLVDLSKTKLIDVPPGAEGEGAPGVNIEQVAALNPDLILAINDFGLEQDYPKLSKIAPTVGFKKVWGGQSWQEQTLVGAKALGLEQRGQQEIAKTEAAIRAARNAHPGLAGKSVTFSFGFAPGQIVTLKSDQDPAVKLLEELGMQVPRAVRNLPDIAPGNPGGALSFENLSLLDADIIVMGYGTEELRKQVEDLELFKKLRGVRDGRYVVMDLPTISALRTPTVLSIRWGLEQIRSSLDKVAR